jgi:uncharacterized membrane protein (DUF4010 family)
MLPFAMDTIQLYQRLGLALAIGLLIGIERGWQEREGLPGSRAAGIRTHALIGLLGGVWGLIEKLTSSGMLGFAVLAFGITFAFFEWRENKIAKSASATGLVAALLNFALGAYAVLGDMAAAAAAAVAATVILAERNALHGFLEKLKWTELRSALLLLVMTVVLLPLLPDRTIDPWQAINPFQIWTMIILTAAVSYGGYAAVRLLGGRKGLLLAGAAGGLTTSTTVTFTFARIAKQHPSARLELLAGIAAAWAVSLLRMTAIALVFAPALALDLGRPMAFAVVIVTGAAALFYRRSASEGVESGLTLEDPFEIAVVLRFGILLVVIMVAAKLLAQTTGETGLLSLAAFSGLADVDPITLSVARLSGTSISTGVAAAAILTAAGANMVAKCVVAVLFGGFRFALPLFAVAAFAGLGAAATLLWT